MSEIAFIISDVTLPSGELGLTFELRVNADNSAEYDPFSPASCLGAYLAASADRGILGSAAHSLWKETQKRREQLITEVQEVVSAGEQAENAIHIAKSEPKILGADGGAISSKE
jgi:hypothetical protein